MDLEFVFDTFLMYRLASTAVSSLHLPHQPHSTTVTEHLGALGCKKLWVRMAEDSTNIDTNKHREENLSLKLRLTTIQF